jgi:hypothetical protein
MSERLEVPVVPIAINPGRGCLQEGASSLLGEQFSEGRVVGWGVHCLIMGDRNGVGHMEQAGRCRSIYLELG